VFCFEIFFVNILEEKKNKESFWERESFYWTTGLFKIVIFGKFLVILTTLLYSFMGNDKNKLTLENLFFLYFYAQTKIFLQKLLESKRN